MRYLENRVIHKPYSWSGDRGDHACPQEATDPRSTRTEWTHNHTEKKSRTMRHGSKVETWSGLNSASLGTSRNTISAWNCSLTGEASEVPLCYNLQIFSRLCIHIHKSLDTLNLQFSPTPSNLNLKVIQTFKFSLKLDYWLAFWEIELE